MITNQEIAVIQKMFRKTKEKTDPIVAARNNPDAHPKVKEMMAAQNTLRDCITVVMNECMPIDKSFIAEMAIRMCSYVISIAEVEHQETIAHLVAERLPSMHLERMKQGIGIESAWRDEDGRESPNMPPKRKN